MNTEELIKLAEKIQCEIENFNNNKPFQLNVIESASRGKLKETGHSRILADLLKIQSIQESFLKRFLGITLDEKEPEVTAEEGRIDVSIRGKRQCIIIENKVNDAVDQPKQLFRYVDQCKSKFSIEQIYVIYLNSDNYNKPSEDSICGEDKKNVMDQLGNRFKIINYKYDIFEWLQYTKYAKVYDEDIKQPHIESALDQYIEYLKKKFNITNEYTNMLIETLYKELDIENLSEADKYLKLKEVRENVSDLISAVDNVLIEKEKQIRKNQLKKLDKLGSELNKELNLGSKIKDEKWSIYQDWVLKIEFNSGILLKRIGIECNFFNGNLDSLGDFRYWITTWAGADWNSMRDKVVHEFGNENLEENSGNRNYIRFEIDGNNHDYVIERLKDAYQKLKNISEDL